MQDSYISYSRIRSFLSCQYRYDLSYRKKIMPRIDSRTPTIGSAGHIGLAAGILGKNVDEALDKWSEEYISNHPMSGIDEDLDASIEDMVDDVKHVTSLIIPRALDNLDLDRWDTVVYKGKPLVEAKFIIPILGWKGYIAVIDWVARDKSTDMTWLIDHKFRKVMQPDEVEEFDLQKSSYQYVLLTHGIVTAGSMSNQVLSKLPSIPSRNKDGTMSRAKISSTWDVYKGCLLNAGLDPSDYLEMKDKLTTEFFRQSYIYRNVSEITSTWKQVIENSSNVILSGTSDIRNLGSLGCRNCWARDYCMEELRGGDIEYLMQTMYTNKNDRKDDEEEILKNDDEEEGQNNVYSGS